MMKSRWFPVFALTAIVAFLVCGQPALAQEGRHYIQARVAPGMQKAKANGLQGYDELFQLASGFGVLAPVDGSGNDEWPCFPGSGNPNAADCSTIATGGAVIGTPAFTWSYAACDASAAGAPNCGQIFWFYEDDTNDTTDHLIVSIVVKQGTNYILDTGNVDLGPNPFSPGSIVVIYDDTAFGTLGETGRGNGFCAGSKRVCANPLTGIATVVVTTKVGPSKISTRFNINLQ